MTDLPLGAVLVGGASRRMGTDKALLELGDGAPMGGRAVAALAPHTSEVVLVGGTEDHARVLGGRVIADPEPAGRGPVPAVVAALREAERTGVSWVVVLPCDLPSIGPTDVAALLDAHRRAGDDVDLTLVVRDGRPQPPCGVWESRATDRLARRFEAGSASFAAVLAELAVATVALGPGFDDADSPGDLDSPG